MLSRVHGTRSDAILTDCQLRDPSSFLRRTVTDMEFCQCKGKILFTKARLIHCLLEIRESLIIIICSIDRVCEVRCE